MQMENLSRQWLGHLQKSFPPHWASQKSFLSLKALAANWFPFSFHLVSVVSCFVQRRLSQFLSGAVVKLPDKAGLRGTVFVLACESTLQPIRVGIHSGTIMNSRAQQRVKNACLLLSQLSLLISSQVESLHQFRQARESPTDVLTSQSYLTVPH